MKPACCVQRQGPTGTTWRAWLGTSHPATHHRKSHPATVTPCNSQTLQHTTESHTLQQSHPPTHQEQSNPATVTPPNTPQKVTPCNTPRKVTPCDGHTLQHTTESHTPATVTSSNTPRKVTPCHTPWKVTTCNSHILQHTTESHPATPHGQSHPATHHGQSHPEIVISCNTPRKVTPVTTGNTQLKVSLYNRHVHPTTVTTSNTRHYFD